jgi:hypothetical protein
MPAAATWNVFPVLTVIGWPAQDPNRYLVLAPEFQISSPTRDHAVPEFVQETVPEFEVAPAEAAFHVILDPPVVYPVPPPSWVMSEVAVGTEVPRRMLVAVTAEKALSLRISARMLVAVTWSNIAMTRHSLPAARKR